MPPAMNNHTETASTVPVTPSTPVATNPPRITQSFLPPNTVKPIQEITTVVNVTNNQSKGCKLQSDRLFVILVGRM